MRRYQHTKYLLFTFFLIIHHAVSDSQMENTTRPEVTIPQGILAGKNMTTLQNRSISAFLGIPYARAPIGMLRFANPVAADGWNGTLNAVVDSNKCPQISHYEIIGDEDCLYVNVYTPQLPTETHSSSLLSVMVYIHGGAFQTGSQVSTKLGPGYLLDEDVVLVTVNYRLGPLGFLSTGDDLASGNWGLKDQVLALRWVQDNVRHFGGDPDRVTLFGESAGATSVHLLSLSNSTVGLFHRYITQSGSALATWAYRPRGPYSRLAFKLGEYVGCHNDTTKSLIDCLRRVDTELIIATQGQFLVWQNQPDIVWGPTDEPDVGNAILTDSPQNLIAGGNIRDLPWTSGVVRDEGLLQTTILYENDEIRDDFFDNIDLILPLLLSLTYREDSGKSWVTAMKSFYLNDGDDLSTSTRLTSGKNSSELLRNVTRMITDSHFFYPAYNALKQHNALAKSAQYFYTFNYRGVFSHTDLFTHSTKNYGISHTDDLLYIFPPDSRFSDLNKTQSEADLRVVRTMVQLWTSFVIDGIPKASIGNGTVKWEPYSERDNYLSIGDETSIECDMRYPFFEDRMQFWANMNDLNYGESAALALFANGVLTKMIFAQLSATIALA